MKPLLLLFLCTILSIQVTAQIEVPFPDTTAAMIWNQTHFIGGDPPPTTPDILIGVQLSAGNDELNYSLDTINNQVYHKLSLDAGLFNYPYYDPFVNDDQILGYYRVEGEKVYYQDRYNLDFWVAESGLSYYSLENFGDSTECLLYDFGLTAGDSFLLDTNTAIIVESVDSIQIQNQWLKRINFQDSFQLELGIDNYSWIEGIGSTIGFFPRFRSFEEHMTFNCFYEIFDTWGTYFTYSSPNSNHACMFLDVDEIDYSSFTISPNPADELIHIEFSFSGKHTVQLYDASGKECLIEVMTGADAIIDVSKLDPGYYLLRSETAVQRVVIK